MPEPSFEKLLKECVEARDAWNESGLGTADPCWEIFIAARVAVVDYEFDLQEKLKMAKSLLEMSVAKNARYWRVLKKAGLVDPDVMEEGEDPNA